MQIRCLLVPAWRIIKSTGISTTSESSLAASTTTPTDIAESSLTGSSSTKSSTTQEENSAGQGSASAFPIIPVQPYIPVSGPGSQDFDFGVTSSSASALEASKESQTQNAVATDTVSAAPASLPPEPATTPLSTQKSADSITTPALTSGSSASTANSATQSEIALSSATSTSTVSPTPSGSTYIALSGSQYIIESKTLGLGSSIEIGAGSSTLVVELHTATNSATEIVVGSSNSKSTSTLTSAGAAISLPVPIPTKVPPPLNLAGSTYPANSLTHYSLASDLTLTPGGVATFSGTEISLATSGSIAVVGSSTQTLSAPQPTTTTDAGISSGLGGSTTTGLGGGAPSGSSSAPVEANAAGGKRSERSNGLCWMSLVGIVVATGYLRGVL